MNSVRTINPPVQRGIGPTPSRELISTFPNVERMEMIFRRRGVTWHQYLYWQYQRRPMEQKHEEEGMEGMFHFIVRTDPPGSRIDGEAGPRYYELQVLNDTPLPDWFTPQGNPFEMLPNSSGLQYLECVMIRFDHSLRTYARLSQLPSISTLYIGCLPTGAETIIPALSTLAESGPHSSLREIICPIPLNDYLNNEPRPPDKTCFDSFQSQLVVSLPVLSVISIDLDPQQTLLGHAMDSHTQDTVARSSRLERYMSTYLGEKWMIEWLTAGGMERKMLYTRSEVERDGAK